MGDALLRRKKMRAKGAQQGPGAEHPNGATAHSPAFKKLILFKTVLMTSVETTKEALVA